MTAPTRTLAGGGAACGAIRALAASGAVLLGLAASAAAGTWVVDDDGGIGVGFTDIQPAIDAAAPGDTILVRDGLYGSFILERGVAIVADTGHAPVLVELGAEIRNVPAGETALLAGFEVPRFFVHDCAGTVLLDDCTFGPHIAVTSVRLYHCTLVGMSRSTVVGQNGGDESLTGPSFYERRAVEVLNSTVVWSACSLTGGRGGTKYTSGGRPGEPAILARGSLLFCQSSTIRGGTGGSSWGPDPSEFDCDGGDGAPALSLDDCEVELHGRAGDVVHGGDTGVPSWIGGVPGTPASAIVALDSGVLHSGVTLATYGGVAVFDGTGSTLTTTTPAVPALTLSGDALLGGSLEPVLQAPPGAQFLLWTAPFAGVQQVGTKHTQLLVDPGFLLTLALDTVGPSGSYSLPLAVPANPLFQGLPASCQAPAPARAGGGTVAR
jgi:hypothetical protein